MVTFAFHQNQLTMYGKEYELYAYHFGLETSK